MSERRSRIPAPLDRAAAEARAADERLAAEHPGEHLRRRDFLERTAALAGAAGLAAALPASTLVAEAAKRQSRVALPSPRNMPIDTVVVLMMENRSFDHYLGWFPGADARNEGLEYPDKEGKPVKTYRLTPDFQGCGHPDPDHGWKGGRWQWNNGKNDRFVTGNEEGTGSDEFAVGYYLKEDVGFLPHAAAEYALYDRFFCSIMASTYPNRHYMWGAQNGGQKSNDFPPETEQRTGFTWETIFDRALSKGLTAKYYHCDLPFSGLYGQRGISWTHRIDEYYADAAAGRLPNIAFVDPPFTNGGGGDGTSADEHPHGDIRLGQAFMSDVAHAFMESPQYRRGVLFVTYDEWGGFFDHVPPPRVPDQRQNNKDIFEDWSLMGFRVPTFAISPYSKGAGVKHPTMGFESILKMISYRYGLGHLNRRHRYAYNIARTLNWNAKDMQPAQLPDPQGSVARTCSTGGQGETPPQQLPVYPSPIAPGAQSIPRPKPHDLALLQTTGLLERVGYEVREPTFEQIFREPDSVIKAKRKADGLE